VIILSEFNKMVRKKALEAQKIKSVPKTVKVKAIKIDEKRGEEQ